MAGPMDFIQEHPGIVVAGAAALGLLVFSQRGNQGQAATTPTAVTQSSPGPAYITADQFNQALGTYDSNIREYMNLLIQSNQMPPAQPPNPNPPPPVQGPPSCGPGYLPVQDSSGWHCVYFGGNCTPTLCDMLHHWDSGTCSCQPNQGSRWGQFCPPGQYYNGTQCVTYHRP